MVRFQKSSAIVSAVSPDVSFYVQYFTTNHSQNAIERFYAYRDKIANEKTVFESSLRDNSEFSPFFYDNALNKLDHPELFTLSVDASIYNDSLHKTVFENR